MLNTRPGKLGWDPSHAGGSLMTLASRGRMHSCLRMNSFGVDLTWSFSRVVLFGGTHNRLGSIISASVNKATLTVQPTQGKKDGHVPQSSLAVHPIGSPIGKAIDGSLCTPRTLGCGESCAPGPTPLWFPRPLGSTGRVEESCAVDLVRRFSCLWRGRLRVGRGRPGA